MPNYQKQTLQIVYNKLHNIIWRTLRGSQVCQVLQKLENPRDLLVLYKKKCLQNLQGSADRPTSKIEDKHQKGWYQINDSFFTFRLLTRRDWSWIWSYLEQLFKLSVNLQLLLQNRLVAAGIPKKKWRENFEGKTFWRPYQNSEFFYLISGWFLITFLEICFH